MEIYLLLTVGFLIVLLISGRTEPTPPPLIYIPVEAGRARRSLGCMPLLIGCCLVLALLLVLGSLS